jgi:hypothetical protein
MCEPWPLCSQSTCQGWGFGLVVDEVLVDGVWRPRLGAFEEVRMTRHFAELRLRLRVWV